LRLLPLPDVLVLADRYDAYTSIYKGCTVLNPGSLLPSDFTFMVYYPAKLRSDDPEEARRCVELSKIE
jgi:DNA polymerase epsilon subunit 2